MGSTWRNHTNKGEEERTLKLWRQWKSMAMKQRFILIGMLLILLAAIAVRIKAF